MCFVQILIVCVVQRDWLSELPNAALLLQIPTEGAEIPPARLQNCKTVQNSAMTPCALKNSQIPHFADLELPPIPQ